MIRTIYDSNMNHFKPCGFYRILSLCFKLYLPQAGTVALRPQMFKSDVKPKTNKQFVKLFKFILNSFNSSVSF